MLQLPTAPCISSQLPEPLTPYLGTLNLQQYIWCSWQYSQVRELSPPTPRRMGGTCGPYRACGICGGRIDDLDFI